MSELVENMINSYKYDEQNGVLMNLKGKPVGSLKKLNNGYQYYQTKFKGKALPVHRIIMMIHLKRELTEDEVVEHIDGDKLNNRIDNLRIISKRDSGIKGKTGSSGYVGITWHVKANKWQARKGTPDGKRLSLGLFENKDDAISAYNAKAKEFNYNQEDAV